MGDRSLNGSNGLVISNRSEWTSQDSLESLLGATFSRLARNFLLNEEPVIERSSGSPASLDGMKSIGGRAPYQRESSEERLHQSRVSLRRLRTLVVGYRKAFEPAWSAVVSDDLKWYSQALGGVRDLDVLRGHLEGMLNDLDEKSLQDTVFDRIGLDIAAAQGSRRDAQSNPRYGKILDVLYAMPASIDFSKRARRPASPLLIRSLREQWERVEIAAHRARQDSTMRRIHRLRIDLKRAQYISGTFAVLGDPFVERFSHNVEKFQTRLGRAHDYAVAEVWLGTLQVATDLQATSLTNLVHECHARRKKALKDWSREMKLLRAEWDALSPR